MVNLPTYSLPLGLQIPRAPCAATHRPPQPALRVSGREPQGEPAGCKQGETSLHTGHRRDRKRRVGTGSDTWGQEVPCAQCGLSRLPESPEGLGAHHGVGGAGGRPQLCRPGLPDRARENEGLQEALSFRGAPTIMNLSRVSVSRVIWGDVYVYIFPRICSM